MENKDNLELTPSDLRVKIYNKTKAYEDLANWLAGRSSESEEFKKVLKDKQLLQEEIRELELLLEKKDREFTENMARHEHKSFEL